MPDENPDSRVQSQPARFRCLRCDAEFELPYTSGKVEERACPQCESNSVWRLKSGPEKPAVPAGS
jgi:Zn finger protein HypA/HybF involved in hydrogenase expression